MRFLFLILTLLVSTASLIAQKDSRFNFNKIQSGPYFGIQQGRNIVVELGYERRNKEIQFKSPNTHAFDLGANYDYKAKLVGADLGYWFRPNRIGFTFGAQIAARTNFNKAMFGVSPLIGYKIWLLHANAGYNWYPNKISGVYTNTLFVSVRLILVNKSKIKRKE
jgi:hypothetical protein